MFIQNLTIDINSPKKQPVQCVAHANDLNSRCVDVSVLASNLLVDLTGYTATASYVVDNVILNEAVDCEINPNESDVNVVRVFLDKAKIGNICSGLMTVEITLKHFDEDNKEMLISPPFSLNVLIGKSNLKNAKTNESSIGSYSDVVREIAKIKEEISNKPNNDDVYLIEEADEHFLSADDEKNILTKHLSDGAVTTDKLTAGSVTMSKIANNSINSAHLLDNSITDEKIADGAVTTDKIGFLAITGNKIASNTISEDRLVPALRNKINNTSGGGGSGGTTDYNDLFNKPKINGVELNGDIKPSDLGIKNGEDYVLTDTDKTEIANIVINEYDSSIMAILGGDNGVTE